MPDSQYPIPEPVKLKLDKAQNAKQRIVLLNCGNSGSGKSTLARNIVDRYPNFERLSIDKHVFETHGVYDVDYPASRYSQLQSEAEEVVIQHLKTLLRDGKKDVVLDLSFYSKEMRDEYRGMIEEDGEGRCETILVVFKGTEEVLWRRIEERRKWIEEKWSRGEGSEGMSVGRETLRMYLRGFEWPGEDEGGILIEVV
ncbi:hypothetical protein EG329_014280 [Mollisiaceae sp. DMI_Dod_QoI]|nr:hypothetical protein EG329_014280 [Helotiales sp. DMI_Dod_QoI]